MADGAMAAAVPARPEPAETANPLLRPGSSSSEAGSQDGGELGGGAGSDGAAEAAAVVAPERQWAAARLGHGVCLLVPPCDLRQLRSAAAGCCSAATWWQTDEALLHLRPWRTQPEPEPEPEATLPAQWSRALWTQPAHTRHQATGLAGSCSLAGGSSAVSAAGQRACHEAAVGRAGEQPQGYASHVQIDALGDGAPDGAPPVLLLERPTQTGSVVW